MLIEECIHKRGQLVVLWYSFVVVQAYLTLSHPMDCSLPGSSIHGIFQARVLEWGAIAFSKFVLNVVYLGKYHQRPFKSYYDNFNFLSK